MESNVSLLFNNGRLHTFSNSMDAYHKRGIEEEKRRKLLVRRQRLSELLEKENKEYEVLT